MLIDSLVSDTNHLVKRKLSFIPTLRLQAVRGFGLGSSVLRPIYLC